MCASNPSLAKCQSTDFIGIYLETKHYFYTRFFGSETIVSAKTVAKIEPQGYDR
jgi:hypothetical protein